MKKLLAFVAILGMFVFGSANFVIAQDENQSTVEQVVDSAAAAVEEVVEPAAETVTAAAAEPEEEKKEVLSFHQALKRRFIEGGATFMSFVFICFIIGLALAIERIIYLNMATTNTAKLLGSVESALQKGGVEAAKEVCRNTRGPVASIFYQGLDR